MIEKQTFIDYLAEEIIEKYATELQRTVVVFPNQRAGLFFQQALQHKLPSPSWLPEILSVEAAFSNWSGIKIADQIDLIFELYRIHFSIEEKINESLSAFASYGFQMLKDFEEVDHYLVESDRLFNYLSEAKALEIWHPDGSPLSSYEQQYLHFFRQLNTYHQELTKYMQVHKLGYYGFVCRQLAQMKASEILRNSSFDHVILAGFNVLSKAEETVFDILHETGKAAVYWDADSFLLDKNEFGYHEGGKHIRRLLTKDKWNATLRSSSMLLSQTKEVHIIGVSSAVGQAFALAPNLLSNSVNADGTAVVLADERLLLPVLNMIPEQLEQFNVTMGLPFDHGAIYSFVVNMLEIAVYQQKTGHFDSVSVAMLDGILQNEILRIFNDSKKQKQLTQLRNVLIFNGYIFVDLNVIAHLFPDKSAQPDFIQHLFSVFQQAPVSFLSSVYQLIHDLIAQSDQDKSVLKVRMILQQLATLKKLVSRLHRLLQTREEAVDFKSLNLLFVNLSRGYQLRISGEPLHGLQVMGMLETRNIDFNTVHLLSANEGILPKSKSNQSLIPQDIRRQFGLPSAIDQQAVYAFHFFRLLQFAETMYVYYNSEPDPLGGGEMSRFLLQLKFELTKLNPSLKIIEKDFNLNVPPQSINESIVFEKNNHLIGKINSKLHKGLSPTAISRYLDCSLKFLLTDVFGIRENTQPDGTIALNTLGSVVHESLETLYTPYTNQLLTVSAVQEMRKNIDKVLSETFQQNYPGGNASFGYNKLAYVVANKFVEKVLDFEYDAITSRKQSIVLLSQEVELLHSIEINKTKVVIKGTIDRIDKADGIIRIIDYKTGSVISADLKVSDIEELLSGKKSKALQLAIYQYLFKNSEAYQPGEEIVAGLLSLRSINAGFLPLEFQPKSNDIGLEEAVNQVIEIVVSEMLNQDIPFSQTSDVKKCEKCHFSTFCQR